MIECILNSIIFIPTEQDNQHVHGVIKCPYIGFQKCPLSIERRTHIYIYVLIYKNLKSPQYDLIFNVCTNVSVVEENRFVAGPDIYKSTAY